MAKKRNVQIPEEAIEGAAGINDKFILDASETQIMVDEKEEKPTKKNTKTVMEKSISRQVLSTELEEGMSIRTVDNNEISR